MATAQIQHVIPAAAAVHDGNSFLEDENHVAAVAVAQDMTSTEVEADGSALGTEEQQEAPVDNDGIDDCSKKGHEEDCEEEDMAREAEAKLRIAQLEEVVVVDPAAAADAGAKPPVEEGRRGGGRGATKKAKAVVVPVDDDELDGEAAVQAQGATAASEAPEEVELGALAAGCQELKGDEAPQVEE